jgi:SAM-dependent methyltransferase
VIERQSVNTVADLREAYNAIYRRAEFGEREALYEIVWRLLAPAEGEGILDVGCGAGPFLGYAQARGWSTLGVDIADEALKKALGRELGPVVLAQGERLPVASESYRWVVCLGNLEHFLDPAAGARELRRVLAPGGRAVIMLPNAYYSGDLWKRIRTGGREGPNHHQAIDRFASDGEWRALLEDSGLGVVAAERWDKGKRWKRLFPFALAYHFVYQVER